MRKNTPSFKQFWIFIGLTFALTWVFWIPLAVSGQDVMAGPLMIPLLLGGFGPSIAGIIMTYRRQDKAGWRDFWWRSINFKQINMGWYAVIFAIFPLAYGLAILFDMLLGGSPPGADNLVQALASSLVLGVFWLLWHTPEFFMAGIPTGEIVSGVVPFLTFAADVIAMAVLYTWVFNNTRRSILSAILLHFSHNFMLNMLLPISKRADLFQSVFLVMSAIIVVAIWGSKTLIRMPAAEKRKLRKTQP